MNGRQAQGVGHPEQAAALVLVPPPALLQGQDVWLEVREGSRLLVSPFPRDAVEVPSGGAHSHADRPAVKEAKSSASYAAKCVHGVLVEPNRAACRLKSNSRVSTFSVMRSARSELSSAYRETPCI